MNEKLGIFFFFFLFFINMVTISDSFRGPSLAIVAVYKISVNRTQRKIIFYIDEIRENIWRRFLDSSCNRFDSLFFRLSVTRSDQSPANLSNFNLCVWHKQTRTTKTVEKMGYKVEVQERKEGRKRFHLLLT